MRKILSKNCFLFSIIFSILFVSVLFPSCQLGNSDIASVTINFGGSGPARAISAEEKSSAVFDVYFNGERVGTKVSGNFSAFFTVGQNLMARVEAFVDGRRIASGESSLTVVAGENIVNIILREDREAEPSTPPSQPGSGGGDSPAQPPVDNAFEVRTEAELKNALADTADATATIKLMANIDLTDDANLPTKPLTISKDTTLDLNGYTIKQTVTGQRIISLNTNVNPNVTLTLNDTSGAGSGKLTSTDGINVGNMGAIYVKENTTLIMNGGTITGNTSTGGGGAVYIYKGTFIMNRGTLSNNKTYGSNKGGGAIYIDGTSARFEMKDGAAITNNSIDSSQSGVGGGAIYAIAGSISMSGGRIENNEVPGKTCGGVYLSDSATFEMTGGTIKNNTGGNAPHGVNLKSGSTGSITVNGNTITSGGYNTIENGVVIN